MRNVGYVPLLVLPLIGEKKAFQLSSQVRWLKLQAIVGKKKYINTISFIKTLAKLIVYQKLLEKHKCFQEETT